MAILDKIVNMSKLESPLAADSLTATQAKNEFGRALEKVIRGGRVVITKHDIPKAILISIEEFNSLVYEGKLNALTA
jgi:prevent-host-death family protein